MRGWASPDVPSLVDLVSGAPESLHLHDTATNSLMPVLDVLPPGEGFRMYVCGITPYDAAHLGHASTYVAFDLVQRIVRDAGHHVRYVQNVTDVDDPLLERALITGDHWSDLAEREIERFRLDMEALRVLAPDEYIGAVESIPSVIDLVEQLKSRGAAYRVDDDWYFDISSDPGFGDVAHLSEAQMLIDFGERGGDPDREGKRHRLDPLLWMAQRADDPWWDSTLGKGRPGWHIECVAIANAGLQPHFDLQGGGSDLVFPHHQMCASISRTLTHQDFARHYTHTGMVALDGEKMSKSKGNLEFVSRLREQGHDPMAIRLALLTQHYRSDWEWTAEHLTQATERLGRWRTGVARDTTPAVEEAIASMRSSLAHDLDTATAIKAIDAWCDEAGQEVDVAPIMSHAIDALLGIRLI